MHKWETLVRKNQRKDFLINISIWKGTIIEKQIYYYYPTHWPLGKKGKLIKYARSNTWQSGPFNAPAPPPAAVLSPVYTVSPLTGYDFYCFVSFWWIFFSALYSEWGCKARNDWATFTFTFFSAIGTKLFVALTPMIKASPLPTRNTRLCVIWVSD